ncbi:very short patch repair endonuclease [Halomonas cupida]|uniref:very short patch repair endonuclease n=1 Tax=Halomonas cupida TaxID=44933 RepID=UPI003A93EEDE
MAEKIAPETRSRMMSSIRGRDTRPELELRRFLHAVGYRFRLQRRDLPGRPDLVLPRHRLAVFVHGCFWHRHPGCHYCSTPATRAEFWQQKFADNIARDQRNQQELERLGWRVLVVWECGFKHCLDRLDEIPLLIEAVNQCQQWPHQPPRPSC